MARAEREVQVGLRRVGRQAGRRPGALPEHHDHGQLSLAGQAEPLDHEREAAAGGADCGPLPRVGVPKRHHHGGDLALRLDHLQLEARCLPGQVVQQAARRRHRVARVRPQAAADEAEPGGLESRHHRTGTAARQVDEQLLGGELVPEARHAQVQLGLLGLIATDHVLERGPRDRDRLAEGTEDRAVAHHRGRLLLLEDGPHRDPGAEGVGHGGQAGGRDRLVVVDGHGALFEPPVVPLERLLSERDHHVDVVTMRRDTAAMGTNDDVVVTAADERRRVDVGVEPVAQLVEQVGDH